MCRGYRLNIGRIVKNRCAGVKDDLSKALYYIEDLKHSKC